ncbi:MAG: hypothetical protein COA86_11990 [Kangiella sp.]|nr:MAG: hypothetical protein COA86_11990 [Kangiella sp.]
MGYQIDATIVNGKPSLKIWDIKNHSLCLSWTYQKSENDCEEISQKEIQRLFRKLLLLTLQNDLSNVRVFSTSTEASGH